MFFFIPYGTDRPPRHFPYATCSLIAVNVLVYLAQLSAADPEGIVRRFAFRPDNPNLVSWFTYMFLHGSIMHLGGNMLYLWLFGGGVECALGWWLFLPTYLLAGCVAMLLHFLIVTAVDPLGASVPMVGASGAIAGILGIYALRFYQTKVRVWYVFFIRMGTVEVASMWFIGFWIAGQLWTAVNSTFISPGHGEGVAYWAHIGGFGLGMLYALLINLQSEGKTEYVMEDAQNSYTAGSFARALQLSDEILRREPGNQEARRLKALAATHHGNEDIAMQELEALLRHAVKQRDHEQVGNVYREMQALRSDSPSNAALLLSVATSLSSMQQAEEALAVYQKITSGFPQSAEAETATIRCSQLYLTNMNMPQQAIQILEGFIHRYPQSQWLDFAQQSLRQARSKAGLS